MSFWKKLLSQAARRGQTDKRSHWLYVRCGRCNEVLQARVDLYNDLSPVYGETSTSYFCRKVVMGQGRCFQKIEVELSFGPDRQLTDSRIRGGSLISAEEYHNQAMQGSTA